MGLSLAAEYKYMQVPLPLDAKPQHKQAVLTLKLQKVLERDSEESGDVAAAGFRV